MKYRVSAGLVGCTPAHERLFEVSEGGTPVFVPSCHFCALDKI